VPEWLAKVSFSRDTRAAPCTQYCSPQRRRNAGSRPRASALQSGFEGIDALRGFRLRQGRIERLRILDLLAEGLQIGRLGAGYGLIARHPLVRVFLRVGGGRRINFGVTAHLFRRFRLLRSENAATESSVPIFKSHALTARPPSPLGTPPERDRPPT